MNTSRTSIKRDMAEEDAKLRAVTLHVPINPDVGPGAAVVTTAVTAERISMT